MHVLKWSSKYCMKLSKNETCFPLNVTCVYVSDEDEVGDRITVRSDEELKAMLSYVSMPAVWMWVCS